MNVNYHKIDSKILQYNLNSAEFKFGMWITKKEFGQRLNDINALPKGQFYMSIRIVANDINVTEKIARRLIKEYTEVGIIRAIELSRSPKKGSIYEYLVQIQEGTYEDTVEGAVKSQEGHSKSEEISKFDNDEGHNKGTMKGTYEDTVEGASKKKNKRKIKENEKDIYSSNDFEELWKLYPLKRGKQKAMESLKKILNTYSKEQIERCINRYIKDVEDQRVKFKDLQYKNGSTFFNNGYIDYLDSEYKEESLKNKSREGEKVEDEGEYEKFARENNIGFKF